MPMSALEANLKKIYQLVKSGELLQAKELCGQIQKIHPNQADLLNLAGVIHAKMRQYDEADRYFNEAIKNAPNRSEFYANYANSLLEQNNIPKATESYQQAIKLNPGQAELHNSLGIAFFKAVNISDAIRCFNIAIELRPDYAEAYNNCGLAHNQMGLVQKAQTCFTTALKLRPDFNAAAINLANIDSIWLTPIKGNRIILKRADASDASYLWQCLQQDEFMELYNCLIDRGVSLEKLTQKLQDESYRHPIQTKSITWIIHKSTHLDQNQPIGVVNLADIQLQHKKAEFLIGLPTSSDRSGSIATEAAFLALNFAFNKVNLNKLTSFVYCYNLLAQENTLHLGFKQEGVFEQHLWNPKTRQFVDVFANGMTADQFRNNQRLIKLTHRFTGTPQ